MRLEFQDSIDRYVLGRMADDEKVALEEKLSKSDELKEQMKLTKVVRDILERNEDLDILDRIEKMDEEYEMENSGYKATDSRYERTVACPKYDDEPPRSSMRHALYWISGIAAVFIVGFFMYSSLNVYDVTSSKQNEVSYTPPQGISTIRGIDVSIENLLAKGDYQEALSRIETLEKEVVKELLVIERQRESRGVEEKELAEKQKMLNYRQEGLLILKVQTFIYLDRMEEALSLIPQLDKIRQSESEFKNTADSLYVIVENH